MKVITDFKINQSRDIEQALRLLDSAFYVPIHKYREDYIFDEDQSVRWNREEVKRKNQEQHDLHQQALEMRAESQLYFLEELYRYIQEDASEFSFSREEAATIWTMTLLHHEAEPWIWVDDMACSAGNFRLASEASTNGKGGK